MQAKKPMLRRLANLGQLSDKHGCRAKMKSAILCSKIINMSAIAEHSKTKFLHNIIDIDDIVWKELRT